jgi:hypothetical protein
MQRPKTWPSFLAVALFLGGVLKRVENPQITGFPLCGAEGEPRGYAPSSLGVVDRLKFGKSAAVSIVKENCKIPTDSFVTRLILLPVIRRTSV